MTDYEKISNIRQIYEKLQDAESKDIFESKVSLMIYKDRIQFWDSIKKQKDWYSLNLNNAEYFIFGAGEMGLHIQELIEKIGKKVKAFLDNDGSKVGQYINGVPVMRVEQTAEYANIPIIFSSRLYENEMKKQLVLLKIKNPVIKEEEICLFYGKQYFDVFEPQDNEIFIDAGAYDGGTIQDFIQWCGGNYEMIYSFEPDKANYEQCKECIENNGMKNIQLIPKGTYDKETILRFDASGNGGSHIEDSGNSTVEVTTIDNVLQGKKATYIKMDVEGCEIESLYGARKTIERHKPRLAICVYHKPLDYIEIPLLLLDMNPSYKFYLRHYASNLCETVLYAY